MTTSKQTGEERKKDAKNSERDVQDVGKIETLVLEKEKNIV